MKYIRTLNVALVRDQSVKLDLLATNGHAVAKFIQAFIGDSDREHFVVTTINARGRVTGIHTVSIGTVTASLAHPREILKVAILDNASAIILAHNHPSDETEPSDEDIRCTKRVEQAAAVLGIDVFDHLVVGSTGFNSLKFGRRYSYLESEAV